MDCIGIENIDNECTGFQIISEEPAPDESNSDRRNIKFDPESIEDDDGLDLESLMMRLVFHYL